MTLAAEAAPATQAPAYNVRGVCRQAFLSKAHEQILAGPSDVGKTWAYCLKAHAICAKYPRVNGSIVRKTYASMRGSVLQTFNKVVWNRGVELQGGEYVSTYIYPNGSRLWVGGMDKPEKILSSERDFFYVNQAEQLSLNDWEMILSRATGRGAVIPHPQVFGDCNPGGSKHWIRQRASEGKLALFSAKHTDNPTLFNDDGTMIDTDEARRRLAILEGLTGIRRKRYFEGLWATSEGAVYEMFDATSELFVRERDPREMVRWFLALDEGFTNPWVILLVGADNDGRWHIFREYYEPKVLQADVVAKAKEWFSPAELDMGLGFKPCEIAVSDAAGPGFIAALNAAGVYCVPGKGDRDGGIHNIQDRLKVQADGRTRLTVDPACKDTINEFESYAFKPGTDEPVKAFDHAMDAIRYLDHVMAEPTGAFDAKTAAGSQVGGGNPAMPGPRQFTPRHRFEPRRIL